MIIHRRSVETVFEMYGAVGGVSFLFFFISAQIVRLLNFQAEKNHLAKSLYFMFDQKDKSKTKRSNLSLTMFG